MLCCCSTQVLAVLPLLMLTSLSGLGAVCKMHCKVRPGLLVARSQFMSNTHLLPGCQDMRINHRAKRWAEMALLFCCSLSCQRHTLPQKGRLLNFDCQRTRRPWWALALPATSCLWSAQAAASSQHLLILIRAECASRSPSASSWSWLKCFAYA